MPVALRALQSPAAATVLVRAGEVFLVTISWVPSLVQKDQDLEPLVRLLMKLVLLFRLVLGNLSTDRQRLINTLLS